MSINLEKGAKINLKKEDGSELKKIFLGLGWDVSGDKDSIDLDASCAMFDENKTLIDTVSFRQLSSTDRSIKHSGDNLTGEGDGDDEVINVDLSAVSPNIKSIVFTINSFRGQTFDTVKNCFTRVVDSATKKEICIYKLAEQGKHTGMIMCKVYRHNGEWKVNAMGTPCNGRTIQDISREIVSCL